MIPSNYSTLICDIPSKYVLRVTLNRAAAANALNTQMGKDLHHLFTSLILDAEDLRCIIITGAGSKVFCAGGVLKERNKMSVKTWGKQHAIFEQAFYALMDCPIPVIAAINGAAYGGGCELALAADFIHAAENAHFALTEVRLGIIPGGGGTQNLPRAVGSRRAKELIFTAKSFSAQEAKLWGMVNQIWAADKLEQGVFDLATQISSNAPVAIRQVKRAITTGFDTDLKTGLALEIEAYNRTIPTEDRCEGIAAFNEKRQANFRGF